MSAEDDIDVKLNTEPEPRPSITRLVERLRNDGHEKIAHAVETGYLLRLIGEELATIDALVYGTGVIVDGERVNPMAVKLITYEAKT